MPLSTTSELLTRLKAEVRDESSTTDTETRLLARLNDAYFDVISGGSILNDDKRGSQSSKPFFWSWAVSNDPIIFNTEAPIENLTVTVNQSSTALTLSATYANSLAGWFLRVDGDEEVYKIAAHTAGTAAVTLDSGYVDADIAGSACDIFKLDYEVGTDVLLPTNGLINYKYDMVIPIVDGREADKQSIVRRAGKGYPSRAYIVKNDRSANSVTLRFDDYPENIERFELPYIPVPSALTTSGVNPILPAHHNLILVEYAAAMEYDLRDSDSAKLYMRRAVERFKAMKAEDRQFRSYQDDNYGKVIAWSRNPEYIKDRQRRGGHPRNNGSN